MLCSGSGKRILSTLFVFALFFFCRSAACAAAPEDALEKGSVPARSTELDRSAYVDAGAYEAVPVTVETVKIGLRYGSDAVSYAEFENESDEGFLIGRYDAARQFHELKRVESGTLSAWRVGKKIALSGGEFYEEYDGARGVALLPLGEGPVSFQGGRYRGGFRLTGWEDESMTVTNYVALEDYVKGVIPYEMSSSWPLEALRAQAVCARTYVVYNQNKYEEFDFDLTADTQSQVYGGLGRATTLTDHAVDSTAGLFVRYRGELCEIYYSASDGGATEDGKNVFGSERPYLAGKTDPFEDVVDFTGRDWTSWRDGRELSWRLKNNDLELGTVSELEPQYSELGNVIAIRYTDENGEELLLTGRDSYAFIGLSNCRFRLEREDGRFVFRGNGWGHNCGMSQWGARAMAETYGYDCDDIIRFYYTGAYIG